MKRVLWFLLLLPLCAIAQVEVVNESMTCDTNAAVLDIGKFNYLRFKNLPDSAVVAVSTGIVKLIPERKNVYYIPGQKTMENRSTKLTVHKKGKLIFSKDYRFRKLERYIDPVDPIYSGIPFKFGTKKLGHGGSFLMCRKEILDSPAFYPLLSDQTIEFFEITYLRKRQDPVGPIKIYGSKISDQGIDHIRTGCDKLFIENIIIRHNDGSCSSVGTLVITFKDTRYDNADCGRMLIR